MSDLGPAGPNVPGTFGSSSWSSASDCCLDPGEGEPDIPKEGSLESGERDGQLGQLLMCIDWTRKPQTLTARKRLLE